MPEFLNLITSSLSSDFNFNSLGFLNVNLICIYLDSIESISHVKSQSLESETYNKMAFSTDSYYLGIIISFSNSIRTPSATDA